MQRSNTCLLLVWCLAGHNAKCQPIESTASRIDSRFDHPLPQPVSDDRTGRHLHRCQRSCAKLHKCILRNLRLGMLEFRGKPFQAFGCRLTHCRCCSDIPQESFVGT
ncbi:MAG: hypothetical protein NTY25_14715, partial [Planctomycetia bacterium]|nr:hypothetical protein [Planctomycetia bacterium]